jgi:MFS family permease
MNTQPDPRRWHALVVLCVGVLMIVLDATIVNVALPSIQNDLGFTQSSLAWVVNAYLIAFGGLLLLAGRIGDLVGRRSVFLAGLGLFVLASLACGAAQSQEMLVAARFVQGVGGAFTSAVILGMIVTMFPEPREQAKAIGVYAFVASAGGSIGLLAGGVLTELINWHWIFFVNLPIGIVTAMFAKRLLDRDQGIGFGEGAGRTLALGAVAVALLVAFVVREATARNPLVPLRIFRSRNVSGANAVQALSVAGMFGMFFLGALYLERVLGYDPLEIGLAFLPTTLVMGTISLRLTEPLVTRFGAKATMIAGLTLIAAAQLLFARVPVDGSFVVDVMPVMVLFGAGAGMAFPALMTLSMSGATPQDAGLASGLVNTTVQVGGALGLAVLATLSATHTESLASSGHSTAVALTGGYHLAFLIGFALVVASIVVALAVLRSPARDEAPALEPAYEGV